MMYHRMYLRRCSMSSISEESETGDDDHLDGEPAEHHDQHSDQERNQLSGNLNVENCLGDLSIFKEEIREAYEELSTLERQARRKASASPRTFNIHQEDDLDILLDQLQTLEQRLDDRKLFRHDIDSFRKKTIPSTIFAQFDELDQTLATLTNTIKNVEIEFTDSGNSSSSSATSDSTRLPHPSENEEHFSDSGLSQSTDSINLPLINHQISNASSVILCDTMKNNCDEHEIRLALEKMHEANIKKLFVKIHTEDQSTKNILIDETMSIYHILILLCHKYHLNPTLNYSIIEDLTDLHIYRIFEDHQNLINDGLIYWTRDTHNRICFQECRDRYLIFQEPKKFFSAHEKSANDILTDYISSDTIVLPDDITSVLYIKEKNRKLWKKHTCVLRQSGIYQIPKSSSSKRDLICLLKFDSNIQLYYANNWTESLRSPTAFGFALKHVHIQKKSNKYIHYFCASTAEECQRWINGIRVIFYGVQLYKNYQRMSQVVNDGFDNLINLLPNQHHINFITANTSSLHQSLSDISLPINQIVFDPVDSHKSLIEMDSLPEKYTCFSLDRLHSSKTAFTRSTSFHSSLRQSKASKAEQRMFRTKSTSPLQTASTNGEETVLKRSKSTKEITSRSLPSIQRSKSNKSSSPSSIIPFIHQCIQTDRTPVRVKPPKRPPPLPPKLSPSISNHIYDSLQDSPLLANETNRTVPTPRLPPPRVTEL